MPIVVSCGVLIVSPEKEILLGLVTGAAGRMDIPKGLLEQGEDPKQCALRECQEETGYSLDATRLEDLGEFKYLKSKNLRLFKYPCSKSEIDLSAFVCSSMFEVKKKTADAPTVLKPEISGVKWVCQSDLSSVVTPNLLAVIYNLI